ncbi:extracellular solute-binding protein [Paenibacillus sambharensis]|nr:extracellular solute-binding protein [Paenibacillus sambharensis]
MAATSYPSDRYFYVKEDGLVTISKTRLFPFIDYLKEAETLKLNTSSIKDFFNGDVAMAFVGLYELDAMYANNENQFKFEYGITSAPHFGDNYSYVIPGDMITISKKSNNKESAWLFIDYMIKEYNNHYDAGTFGWFSTYNFEQQSIRNQQYDFSFEAFYPDLKVKEQDIPVFTFEELSRYNYLTEPYLNEYLRGELEADQLIDKVKTVLND